MYRIIISTAILVLNGFILSAQHSKALSDFKNSRAFPNAIVGVCIQDMQGKEIASLNKNTAMTPASIQKVITTATALEILGADYTFKTELLFDKQNNKLIVRGCGDPTLGSEHANVNVNSFLEIWKEKIIQKIPSGTIGIEVDDSYFGYDGVSNKWIREDMGNYYAAGSYGISVFDNSYKLFFNTMDKTAHPKIAKTEPFMKDITFTNTLTLNTTGKDNGYIIGEPFSNQRLLTGNIPGGRSSFSIKGDIPDPGLYLGQTLGNHLNGTLNVSSITTVRKDFLIQSPRIYNNEDIFYTHQSPPLKDIIRIVNIKSNNHYSEHLIRAIGKTKTTATDGNPLKDGIETIQNFWRLKSIDTNPMFLYDGCGLSPSNAVSPKLMCDILAYMYDKSSHSEEFLASFPKAGQDGTVRNLLKGSKLVGKVCVKSGSIANVQCYAGYYIDGDKKYVFTVMVNNFRKDSRREAVTAIEKMLIEIF